MEEILKSIDEIASRGQQEVVIPDGYTAIGGEAFRGCTSLESVVIPEGVSRIGENAFEGCTSLARIEVASDNPVFCGIDGALYSKDQTILLRVPGTIRSFQVPKSVTKIGEYAFKGCTSLKSVVIPKSVSEIKWSTFEGCTSLESVSIPDSTCWDKNTFTNCPKLTITRRPSR